MGNKYLLNNWQEPVTLRYHYNPENLVLTFVQHWAVSLRTNAVNDLKLLF